MARRPFRVLLIAVLTAGWLALPGAPAAAASATVWASAAGYCPDCLFNVRLSGFAPSESVDLSVTTGNGSPEPVATVQVGTDGSYMHLVSTTTPVAPGSYALTAVGEASGDSASYPVTLLVPRLSLSSSSARPGFGHGYTASGFPLTDRLDMTVDGVPVQTAENQFFLPASTTVGTHTLTLTAHDYPAATASATVTVPAPHLTLAEPVMVINAGYWTFTPVGFGADDVVDLTVTGALGGVHPAGSYSLSGVKTMILSAAGLAPGPATITAKSEHNGATATVTGFVMGSTLRPGQTLRAGQALSSTNGDTRLVMQPDGDLVLSVCEGYPYSKPSDCAKNAFWVLGTSGHPGSYLTMQPNGNLVVFDPQHRPLWQTNTGWAGSSAVLTIQNNFNMVLSHAGGVVWQTGDRRSYAHLPGQIVSDLFSPNRRYGLGTPGNAMSVDDMVDRSAPWWIVTCPNNPQVNCRAYGYLKLQVNGDLVWWQPATNGGVLPVWASNTAGAGPGVNLTMQDDGHLVLRNLAGQTIWQVSVP